MLQGIRFYKYWFAVLAFNKKKQTLFSKIFYYQHFLGHIVEHILKHSISYCSYLKIFIFFRIKYKKLKITSENC